MKKLYIYLLIGFVFFFGFGMEVKAEKYSEICRYASEPLSDGKMAYITIGYSASEKNKYRIDSYWVDVDSNKEYQVIYYFKNDYNYEKGQSYVNDSKVTVACNHSNCVHSFETIKQDYCPLYAGMTKKGNNLCFDNNEDLSNCSRYSSEILANKKQVEKVDNKSKDFKLKDGDYCVIENIASKGDAKLGGGVGEYYCTLRFTYKSPDSISIEYKPSTSDTGLTSWGQDNKETEFTKLDDYETKVPCREYVTTSGTYKDYFYLTNLTLGTSNSDVLISNRDAFNKKFINQWNSVGVENCGQIFNTYGTGEKDLNGSHVEVILDDAKQECLENGCSDHVNIGFIGLEEWDYEFHHWYDNDGVKDCDGLIGPKIKEIINEILMYVKILIPVLLIGFGVADFVRAMFSSDEQAMAKAKNKFIKRLVMAAIIFIIPAIINLIFNSINGIWAHINNEACNIWS